MSIWLTGEQYYCENCGYVGTVVMVLEKEETDTSSKENKDEV